tara:strand:- start:160 stop:1653 length:1494 start_codon:yes stop_codon:yes gene_type:complete
MKQLRIVDLEEPIRTWALNNQRQGDKPNEDVELHEGSTDGGFDWIDTPEGVKFWGNVNVGTPMSTLKTDFPELPWISFNVEDVILLPSGRITCIKTIQSNGIFRCNNILDRKNKYLEVNTNSQFPMESIGRLATKKEKRHFELCICEGEYVSTVKYPAGTILYGIERIFKAAHDISEDTKYFSSLSHVSILNKAYVDSERTNWFASDVVEASADQISHFEMCKKANDFVDFNPPSNNVVEGSMWIVNEYIYRVTDIYKDKYVKGTRYNLESGHSIKFHHRTDVYLAEASILHSNQREWANYKVNTEDKCSYNTSLDYSWYNRLISNRYFYNVATVVEIIGNPIGTYIHVNIYSRNDDSCMRNYKISIYSLLLSPYSPATSAHISWLKVIKGGKGYISYMDYVNTGIGTINKSKSSKHGSKEDSTTGKVNQYLDKEPGTGGRSITKVETRCSKDLSKHRPIVSGNRLKRDADRVSISKRGIQRGSIPMGERLVSSSNC